MSRIGITALFIALAFFIKYAFDQGWVNEIMRIAMGTLMGLVLLSLGEYFDSKRKYPHLCPDINWWRVGNALPDFLFGIWILSLD